MTRCGGIHDEVGAGAAGPEALESEGLLVRGRGAADVAEVQAQRAVLADTNAILAPWPEAGGPHSAAKVWKVPGGVAGRVLCEKRGRWAFQCRARPTGDDDRGGSSRLQGADAGRAAPQGGLVQGTDRQPAVGASWR